MADRPPVAKPPVDKSTPLVVIEKVNKHFGDLHVLKDIDPGTISIDGVELPEEGKALARLRADVGMVFQSFNLFAHKTVLQNVTLGPVKVRKMSKADAKERAMKLLQRVGIAEKAASYP